MIITVCNTVLITNFILISATIVRYVVHDRSAQSPAKAAVHDCGLMKKLLFPSSSLLTTTSTTPTTTTTPTTKYIQEEQNNNQSKHKNINKFTFSS